MPLPLHVLAVVTGSGSRDAAKLASLMSAARLSRKKTIVVSATLLAFCCQGLRDRCAIFGVLAISAVSSGIAERLLGYFIARHTVANPGFKKTIPNNMLRDKGFCEIAKSQGSLRDLWGFGKCRSGTGPLNVSHNNLS